MKEFITQMGTTVWHLVLECHERELVTRACPQQPTKSLVDIRILYGVKERTNKEEERCRASSREMSFYSVLRLLRWSLADLHHLSIDLARPLETR